MSEKEHTPRWKKLLILLLAAAMIFTLPLAGCSKEDKEDPGGWEDEEGASIDYMVLVNQENVLPDGWEEALDLTTITNSVGDEVQTETKAYEAYCALKEAVEKDLDESYDGGTVRLELDSADKGEQSCVFGSALLP